ncbi:MAG: hypothetical protein LBL90_06550 [Prevotellaceae bacterium]|jgi:hypothetical protein|nr:hypothetical protein [Prevotellaceae bacterium]
METLKLESDYHLQNKSGEILKAYAQSTSLVIDLRLCENKILRKFFSNRVDNSLKIMFEERSKSIRETLANFQ